MDIYARLQIFFLDPWHSRATKLAHNVIWVSLGGLLALDLATDVNKTWG
jgi:hypothetical protein